MTKLKKLFEGQWDEIKGKLKKQWGKLSEDDIKQIDGSYDEFVGKLKKIYGVEMAKIEQEIADFFDDYDVEKTKTEKSLKEETLDKADKVKDMVRECVNEYVEKIKDSTLYTEEKLISFCKANPIKTASMMVLASAALAAFLLKRK